MLLHRASLYILRDFDPHNSPVRHPIQHDSFDYLMDGTTEDAAKARFEDRELLRQFQELEKFPSEDKLVIKKVLDAFIVKRHVEKLGARIET